MATAAGGSPNNGEIYNFLELREELAALGHRFKSGSASEVLLAAYEEWGPACQTRFNGMWAFAIWDAKEKMLFLWRDRFGVKPLFWHFDGRRFAFNSEMKAFLAPPSFDAGFDGRAVATAILHAIPSPCGWAKRPNPDVGGIYRHERRLQNRRGG